MLGWGRQNDVLERQESFLVQTDALEVDGLHLRGEVVRQLGNTIRKEVSENGYGDVLQVVLAGRGVSVNGMTWSLEQEEGEQGLWHDRQRR